MKIGEFVQNQVLGMKWLNEIIGQSLLKLGVDINDRIGGSIQFFIYDVLKITILLCVLIFVISYIQSYFPPERSKRIFGTFSRNLGEYRSGIVGNSNSILFLFIYSLVYWFYKCGASAGGYFFLFDFIADG